MHSQTFDKLRETNEQSVVRPEHVFLKNVACASASNNVSQRGPMKKQLQAAIAAMLVLGTMSLHAQTGTAAPAKKTTKTKQAKAVTVKVEESQDAKAILELQEKMAAQQAQIDALTQQNTAKDAALSAAQNTAASSASQAAAASAQAQSASSSAQANTDAVTALKSDVNDLKTSNVGLATTISDAKKDLNDKIDSPSVLHYKGVTITPVAFFAFENVYRQRSVNSDINTPFNSIPMPSANQGHVSELNFSGRQSRLGALFQGDAGSFKLSGYFEGDFLSAGLTSNGNQSNSYTMRQRQFWGQVATKSGFTLTGGQMWSLVTETGKGTDNRTEKLPNSIDAQYTVGFSWTRQPSVRIQQRWGDYKTGAFTAAMSLENAQITSFTATSATSGAVPTNFFFAGAGTGGGLYNSTATYANNVAPDLVIKGVYDLPKAHFELGGIARFLRDYYYPILTDVANVYTYSPNYISNTKKAGGVFASIRVSPSKFADIAVQAMAGDGVGRYGSSQLADATLHTDGTLEPVRNYHGLLSIETHPTPKLDVYSYYGGEYAQRTVYTTSTGALMGYGAPNLNDAGCYYLPANPGSSTGGSPSSPGTCASPTRYIQEGLLGFTYRFTNSPKFGRLQYAVNYQYMQRNLWSGSVSSSTISPPPPTGPRAEDGMVFTSLRYYIP
jgi:hypothetical protein